jgi:tetratricopeptide (TPR) repeat protein
LIAVSSAAVVGGAVGGVLVNARLRAALAQAEAQQRHASNNFRRANQAVKDMLTRVGAVRLADVPEMEEVRRELLTDALQLYEGLLQEEENPDRETRLEYALAFAWLGDVQALLGNPAAAEKGYLEAETRLEQLADAIPERAEEALVTLANVKRSRSALRISRSQEEEMRLLRASIALAEARVRDFPGLRECLANGYKCLGDRHQAGSRFPQAEDYLHKALALRRTLQEEDPADPVRQSNLALSHFGLGYLYLRMGRPEQAEPAYQAALRLWEPLARDEPGHRRYEPYTAEAYTHLGNLCARSRPAEAEEYNKRALAIHERRARQYPSARPCRENLARAWHNLGELYVELGRYTEAEPLLVQAVSERERTVKEWPEPWHGPMALAEDLIQLGRTYQGSHQAERARAAYQRAAGFLEALRAEKPGWMVFLTPLGQVQALQAQLAEDGGQPQEAVGHLDGAIPLLETVLQTEPDHPDARAFLFMACLGRARALVRLGRAGAALADCERAAALGRERDGRPAAPVFRGKDLYELACVHALAVPAAQAQETRSANDRAARAEEHGRQAVDLLRQAQSQGYFQMQKAIEHLRTDADLDAVRRRPEFVQWLGDLERGQAAKDRSGTVASPPPF